MHWIYPGTEPPRDTGDWKPFIKSSKPKREDNLLPINGATRPMRPLENTPATDWKPKKSGSTFDGLPVPIKVENTADQPPSTAKVLATRNTQPSRNASKARKTGKRSSESATEKPPYVCHFKGCEVTFTTIWHRSRHVKCVRYPDHAVLNTQLIEPFLTEHCTRLPNTSASFAKGGSPV